MATTREQMAADRAAFDDEFDQEHVAPRAASDDEVFGLLDDEADEGDAAGTAEQAATPQAQSQEQAQESGTAQANSLEQDSQQAQQSKHLQEWEQRLQAQQIALDARAAAIGTSNVNQQQSNAEVNNPSGEGGEGSHGDDGGGDAAVPDPAIRLMEDFGAEFVALVKLLVAKECKTNLHDCMGDVSSKVDQLIAELTQDRQQHHFRAIAAAHADFQEVVDSPAFTAWQKSQPADQLPEIERVIAHGDAQEIIDLLTRFKQASPATTGNDDANAASSAPSGRTTAQPASRARFGKAAPRSAQPTIHDQDSEFDEDEFDHAALDAAEGVRSGGGLKLPKAPPSSDDYSAAWDEA